MLFPMISFRHFLMLTLIVIAATPTHVYAQEVHTASMGIESPLAAHADESRHLTNLSSAEWAPIAAKLSHDLNSGNTLSRQRAAHVAAEHGTQGMALLLKHMQGNEATNPTDIVPHLQPTNDPQRHELAVLLRTADTELHALLTQHLAEQDFQTLVVLVKATHMGLVDFEHTAEVLRRSTEWGYGWIEAALRAENPDVHEWLALVGALNNPVFLGNLDALFRTGSELLRRHVVRSWSRMDPHWVTDRLLRALDDPRPSVQDEALNGLHGRRSMETDARLMKRVATHGLTSPALVKALGRTATPHALDEFKKAWPTAPLAIRLAMLDAAAAIASTEALAFLFEGTVAHEAVLRERATDLLSQTQ